MSGTSQMGGTGGIDAFLGKGTKVSGKLTFEGAGRIEGQVDGEVTAQDTLTIGQGAIVKAKITGTTVIIEGQVTGDVIARQRLELRSTGRVQGNVTAPALVVQEGAQLDGQCSMSGSEAKARRDTSTETAATSNLDRTRDAAREVSASFSR
jgi:cytoskeletal protein CcmA (bactofilin family)